MPYAGVSRSFRGRARCEYGCRRREKRGRAPSGVHSLSPSGPGHSPYSLGIQAETADVVMSLIRHRATLGPPHLNHGHSLQPHSVLVSPQPCKVIGQPRATPFLPPVAWVVRLVGHVHDVTILPYK